MKPWIYSALAAFVLSVPAFAAVPRTVSYQGILTDNSGLPIPDGSYSLTIRLYSLGSGGAPVYTEVQNPVNVSKGGFNVLIGSVTPLNLVFDAPLWLGLQVGADPELTPRVPLASSPYALGLSLPFDGRANGGPAALMVRNTTGAAIASEGSIQVFTPAVVTPIVALEPFSTIGGRVVTKDEVGNATARIEPDANGTGGFFSVYRNAASVGFSINGNDGTEEPIVTVSGSLRSSVFDMSMAGDASVVLPTDAVGASEISNEPGIAEVFANSAITIGTGVTQITSRTITVPDDGWVLAIGGGHIELGHVNAGDSRVLYGINDVNNAFATSTWVAGVPSGAPTGNYRLPVPFTGVWPVTAGAHTFYLLAQRIGAANGAVLNDPTIALVYFPTAYGTVTGNKPSFGGVGASLGGPPSQADTDAEMRESIRADRARVQRELDEVRAQLTAIQARLSNDLPAAANPVGK